MFKTTINQLRRTKEKVSDNIDDIIRSLLLLLNSSPKIVNDKEIKVVGLRRSGNHAVIVWIRRHYQDYVWHLNNIYPRKNFYRLYSQFDPQFEQEAKGKFSQKSCLIFSYENCLLEDVFNPWDEKKHDLYYGKTLNCYNLIILRDPFNMLASMYYALKKNSQSIYMEVFNNKKNIMELWLDYAKEFLGETNYLKTNKVTVNYNQWCLDQNYRKQVSEQLGLNFSDAGFNVVKGYGGGSSFEGKKLDGQATKMDVMNRWKRFADDPEYRKMFNQEIYNYSEKIFGHIPETESLIDTIN